MPDIASVYRVFIASPSGLEKEREAFKDTLILYNETDGYERGILFKPIGWEITLPGVGRPQEMINKDVRRCDYFILTLWDRWGSPPDIEGKSQYTSGTEEEFQVALECYQNACFPMRQIVVFFKAVDLRQLSDPGSQLSKVLEFRKKLESEKKLLFNTFDEILAFKDRLRYLLAQWVRDHEDLNRNGPSGDSPPQLEQKSSGLLVEEVEGQNAGTSKLAERAESLVEEGRLVEAEEVFAQAVVRGEDIEAINRYGLFLDSLGHYSQSELLFKAVIEKAQQQDNKLMEASGLNNLAVLCSSQRRYADAEQLYKRALEIREMVLSPKHPGVAATLNSLADIYYAQSRYADAEQLYKRALEIRETVLSPEHPEVAVTLNNLAEVYRAEGRYAEAESLISRALVATAIKYYSCFISHSEADSEFVDRLRTDLLANDVNCWSYRYDMKGGQFWRQQINEAIKLHDKLIVVCSQNSLTRRNIVVEVVAALERERETHSQKLFPIRLDDFILSDEIIEIADKQIEDGEWQQDWIRYVRAYHIPDFSRWRDQDNYREQLKRLLVELKNPARR